MADDQFHCPACGGHFHSKQELDEHAKTMHSNMGGTQEEPSLTCSKCAFKAKLPSEMENHSKEHMGSGQM